MIHSLAKASHVSFYRKRRIDFEPYLPHIYVVAEM